MEYRTTHGKVMARLERKKHERERKKTKGKFIVSPLKLVAWYPDSEERSLGFHRDPVSI